MNLDFQTVRGYFAPPSQAYWRWEEGGHVLTWKDGLTICYRDELTAVLGRLAPAGLPPLGSVLLLIGATREKWGVAPTRPALLRTHLSLLHDGGDYLDLLNEVLGGLAQVQQCRSLVSNRPEAKMELAALVFDAAPGRFLPSLSQGLVERLASGLTAEEIGQKPQAGLQEMLHDLGCLRWGLPRVDPDSLALRLKTGLETLPEPAPVEAPPAGSARDLIATLEDDPELGSVARLAKLLLAAVHLPRALSDPEELPIGGVSDVSNRGPLDRLLLSELAYDDLTLAVRVAMNEALYLRRESPPRTPPRQRKVLLDAGLRTWGVPRVFVAAVGLAIAAKSDPLLAVRAFRSTGDEAAPVDFQTRAGLTAHLAALDHCLHPGSALTSLLSVADEPATESDLIVVTTDDTLADPDFQRELHAAASPPLFLASVSRDGRFELIHRTPRGRKTLCTAKFDLADILKPRTVRGTPLIDKKRDLELPAIFRLEKFPLRLSVPFDWQRSWQVAEKDVFTLTRDGRLLHWPGRGQGAKQVIEGLPEGDLLWAATDAEQMLLSCVIGKRSQRGLRALQVDCEMDGHKIVPLQLDTDQPREVLGYGGVLYVFFAGKVNIVSPDTGELLASSPLPSCEYASICSRRGRFISQRIQSDQRHWQAIVYQPGQRQVVLETVWQDTDDIKLLGLFDVSDLEGPRGLTTKLETLDPATKSRQPLKVKDRPGEWAVVAPTYLGNVSRDGRRVIVAGRIQERSGGTLVQRNLLINLVADTLAFADFGWDSPEPRIIPVNPRTLHRKFIGIGITKQRQLALRSRGSSWWVVQHEARAGTLQFPSSGGQSLGAADLVAKADFQVLDDFDRGYKLSLAKFADGSRAWLDSRGLLHLKSSDPGVPECSLILCDGPMAGWLAGGGVSGPEYWRIGPEGLTADGFMRVAIAPFIQRIP